MHQWSPKREVASMNYKRKKKERRRQWNIESEGPPMMELQNKHQK
jgi:hypothetical protein